MTSILLRKFEITLFSAKNLLDVRVFSDMRVYGKVSIRGDPNTEKKTPVDNYRTTNPFWNSKMVFFVDEAKIRKQDVVVEITLCSERSIKSDKYVGEVNLSLRKLSDILGTSHERLEFEVDRVGCVGTFGTLYVSYAFGDPFTVEVRKGSTGKLEFWSKERSLGDNALLMSVLKAVKDLATELALENGDLDPVREAIIEFGKEMLAGDGTEVVVEGIGEFLLSVMSLLAS